MDDLNLADTIVHNRLLYMTADNDGSVAQELKADGKEAEEIASLWANVKAALANKPAVRASAENSAFAYDPMGEIDRLMANLKSDHLPGFEDWKARRDVKKAKSKERARDRSWDRER